MSDWKEDNYLERLALPLDARSSFDLCPDAELLLSSTDQTASANVLESVSQHLEHCPICADIRSRLLQFDHLDKPAIDTEVLDAEGRLDSWLKGFLASQALFPRIPSTRKSPNLLSYSTAPKSRRSPKVLWTLAAALIMAIGFVYFRRSMIVPTPSVSTPSVDVARNSPSQQPPNPQPTDPQPSPQLTPESQSSAPPAPSKSLGHPENSTVASSIPPHAPSTSTPDLPTPDQAPQTSAQATSSSSPEVPHFPSNNPPPTGIPSVSPTTPSAPASLSRRPLTANSGTRSLHTFSGLSKTHSASAPRTTSSLPPLVFLPAGTRIWISLQSPLSQIDGQFEFEGTLLLRVTLSNALILDKGIFIAGFGVTSGTQTSLTITTFKIRGSLYRLQILPAAVGPPKLATGKVVQFQSGNVVELWLDSSTTFEPVPASAGGPQE